MSNHTNAGDDSYIQAKIVMLRLLLSALAEDVPSREVRLVEEMTELLQQDTETIGHVLGVTLRYLSHSMEVAFGSAHAARETIAEDLAALLQQNENE